ncbi:MAG TPA: hypothetical protein VN672_09330 [Solirubrobacteraceae bacterium]|nr:hypothetical protein [Solirubrobacteraceae bacterium]
MADASTIASLATAGGTLVLAIATFGSTRSANRAARVSEQSLKVGLRPVLFNSRPQDPAQKVGYGDDHWVVLRDGLAVAQQAQDGNIYLAMPLRNVASGIAVLHGWHLWPRRAGLEDPHPVLDDFRTQTRDLYVPAGDISFWQAALRDSGDELYAPVREAIASGGPLSVDLLYGDHEGGQRTITRFYMIPRHRPAGEQDEEPWLRLCSVSRHWNIDRADPR